jgi:hypothetical protein
MVVVMTTATTPFYWSKHAVENVHSFTVMLTGLNKKYQRNKRRASIGYLKFLLGHGKIRDTY